jgi:hypothetical protein
MSLPVRGAGSKPTIEKKISFGTWVIIHSIILDILDFNVALAQDLSRNPSSVKLSGILGAAGQNVKCT